VRAAVRLLLAAALVAGVAAACGPAPTTLTVNDAGDAGDANPGNGTCATTTGSCSLRAAIQEADAHQGADAIRFALPGTGVRTIQLTAALPVINDTSGATTIDGYTQAGSSVNTSSTTDTAALRVQVRGTGSGGIDGLSIWSGGNTVRGLALFNFRRAITIFGQGADGNRIVGNFVGTNADGTFGFAAIANLASGIVVGGGASGNVIGSPAAADRNVISGNARAAVDVFGVGSDENLVRGNIVGLSPKGDRRLGNAFGVDVNEGGARNVIGGTGAARNVISGNRGGAVELSHRAETAGNQVVGNYIGTDLTGRRVLTHTTNGSYGVQLQDGVRDNLVSGNVIGGGRTGGIEVRDPNTRANVIRDNWIGVTPQGDVIPNGGNNPGGWGIYVYNSATDNRIGPGNTIANNRNNGVAVNHDGTDRNTITANRFWNNGGPGINLGPLTGVNANDAGDGDAGPNQQLNFPVITTATRSTIAGTSCGGCRVEVFEARADDTAHGEAGRFLGAVTADAQGRFSLGSPGVASGVRVTATATDPTGNTSEFAANKLVSG
jgi:CSLREA domain-containing protein